MKKLFLSVLFLMLSVASFSQPFVNKYTSVINKAGGILGDWKETSITIVFNEETTSDIVIYYQNGTEKRFHRIGDISNDETSDGAKYQFFLCIDDEDGTKLGFQLFEKTATLRIVISEGNFVEFHK
jgi:hypothetical protein